MNVAGLPPQLRPGFALGGFCVLPKLLVYSVDAMKSYGPHCLIPPRVNVASVRLSEQKAPHQTYLLPRLRPSAGVAPPVGRRGE